MTQTIEPIAPPPTNSPVRAALGDALDGAAPAVRRHFGQPGGTRAYRGVYQRVWLAGGRRGPLARPVLWLFRRAGMFLADAGTDVPFLLTHTVKSDAEGRPVMTWAREVRFPAAVRRISGALTFDPARGVLVEWMGPGRWLEAELHCRAEGGELHAAGGRHWLHLFGLRVRLPHLLAGQARLREWQRADGTLATSLVVSSPLLGPIIGWDGTFSEVTDPDDAPTKVSNPVAAEDTTAPFPVRRPRAPERAADVRAFNWSQRLRLGAIAVLGTLAYSLSFLPAAGGRFVAPGAAIGLAAGLSWFVFGASVLLLARGRPSVGRWADACLGTMAVGIVVLSAGTLLNLAAWAYPQVAASPRAFAAAHLAVLVAGNTAMGAAFVRRARLLGLSAARAVGAWVLALDGTFAGILLCLWRSGGPTP